MGDRANLVIKDGDAAPIYLYTHWRGTELPQTLHDGLVRGKERWGDPPYLTRILFCEMVKGDEQALTGFGISASATDGMNIEVDVGASTVAGVPFQKWLDEFSPGDPWRTLE